MVIGDSSTLIHLSAIGRFALLRDLYGRLTATPAVWSEVIDHGKDRTGVADLEAAREHEWLEVRWSSRRSSIRFSVCSTSPTWPPSASAPNLLLRRGSRRYRYMDGHGSGEEGSDSERGREAPFA